MNLIFKASATNGIAQFKGNLLILEEISKFLKEMKDNPCKFPLLENKHGCDLSTCRKVYFNNYASRIVYTLRGEDIVILAIGPRENLEVYTTAHNELKNLQTL